MIWERIRQWLVLISLFAVGVLAWHAIEQGSELKTAQDQLATLINSRHADALQREAENKEHQRNAAVNRGINVERWCEGKTPEAASLNGIVRFNQQFVRGITRGELNYTLQPNNCEQIVAETLESSTHKPVITQKAYPLVYEALHSRPKTLPEPPHRCTPDNTTMQCNLPPAGLTLNLSPTVALAHGLDFAWGGPSADSMRQRGASFGASYLSFDSSKDWSARQVQEYARAGVARVFVWETSATRALAGCSAGAADARTARSEGNVFGARVIYFAVDFELQSSQDRVVSSYFRCAGGVLGRSRIGAYGGIATIRLLFDAHLIAYGWQTYAWSGGRWDGRAQLEQYLNGNSFDLDRALARDYGQTPYSPPKPKPKPKPPHHQLEAELKGHEQVVHQLRLQLAHLRHKLNRYGCARRHHEEQTFIQTVRHHLLGPRCRGWYAAGDRVSAHGRVEDAFIVRLRSELR